MGGALAITLAASHDKVRAVVCFYGVPSPETDLSKIAGAVLGHFGDHDEYASSEAVRKLTERLSAAQVTHTFHTYPGGHHAFANEDRPEVHNAEADKLSWDRSLEFLRQNLQP
jgi:carboxymethylenebutenolidase